MRLINTVTLQLEEFSGGSDNAIPPYSILSHRWGRDEVGFRDMQSERRQHLEGFQKLERFCTLSREEGYLYAWMDTCCIDKSSSAELSEAINSMFRWYRDAAICYAYLCDVTDPPCTDPASSRSSSSLRRSEWFERGWTLQELIAPDCVIFLNAQWQDVGTRTTLAPLLHSITGIHGDLFKPSVRRGHGVSVLLRRFSIAQKLSWASRRMTTRTEDAAYCLMGLLDVNMPLLYGEGSKAFLRLQQHVMNQSDDASIFVWQRPAETRGLLHQPAALSGVLADSPRCFAGSHNVESIPFSRIPAEGSSPLHSYETSKSNVIMRVPILPPLELGEEGQLGGLASGRDDDSIARQSAEDRVVLAILDCQDAGTGLRIVLPLLDLAPGGSRLLFRYHVGTTLYLDAGTSSLPARASIAAFMEMDSRFLNSSGSKIADITPRGLNLVHVRLQISRGRYLVRRAGGKRWAWSYKDTVGRMMSSPGQLLPVELWEATFGMKDSMPGWIIFERGGGFSSSEAHPPFAFACYPQPDGHMCFTLRTLEGQGDELDAAVAGWNMCHSGAKSERRLRLPGGLEAVVKARVGAATCTFFIMI